MVFTSWYNIVNVHETLKKATEICSSERCFLKKFSANKIPVRVKIALINLTSKDNSCATKKFINSMAINET
jgi:hypothetical protein